MLEVDIILNGGGFGLRRCIQRIAIWNVSKLADISDYEYAVSYPCPMGEVLEVPSGRMLAKSPELCQHRGEVHSYNRSLPPMVLVRTVIDGLDMSEYFV